MESFKQADKKKEIEAPKKRFINLMSEDEIEVKRLTMDDVEESVKIMRKCAFDVTEAEVGNILQYGKSFGATVNRMIIGVGLSWPAYLDVKEMKITNNQPNALYLEDPAVLLAYEGRGVRRILLIEREKEASASGHEYVMGYLYEDIPKGNIADYITETGSQLEKLYLSENYQFSRTEKGIMAFKKLGKPEKNIPKE
ncbi:MAG: hypothetical protein ABH842_04730 [Candidatus Micrarchaeota archaeon]